MCLVLLYIFNMFLCFCLVLCFSRCCIYCAFSFLLTCCCVCVIVFLLVFVLFFVEVVMRRSKMERGNSKRVFTKGAQRVHGMNSYRPMRGGIRL